MLLPGQAAPGLSGGETPVPLYEKRARRGDLKRLFQKDEFLGFLFPEQG
jgi:6-phosphogluconolactonase/glucosamine-6-phosphate isomerase/deaminase